MKKLFLSTFALFGFVLTFNAQNIADNAIGLRIGDNDGFGAEISYQRALGDNNRLEADLGWRSGKNHDGFKITGLYQWVFPLEGDFNWYVGAGGGIASYSWDYVSEGVKMDDSETSIFVGGDIGIEYSFDFPLQLSLDLRPEIGFGDYNDDLDFDIALGIRYQF
ncbi:MAG: hypothetical protein ACK5NB_06120 [Flavobacteriaceae bacterium]